MNLKILIVVFLILLIPGIKPGFTGSTRYRKYYRDLQSAEKYIKYEAFEKAEGIYLEMLSKKQDSIILNNAI